MTLFQDDSLDTAHRPYQINMMQVYFDQNIHNKNAVFEVYFRSQPFKMVMRSLQAWSAW